MSLGNCLYTKSTSWIAWRWLAPPRDTIRSRLLSAYYSTIPSFPPQPRSRPCVLDESAELTRELEGQDRAESSDRRVLRDDEVHGVQLGHAFFESPEARSIAVVAQETADPLDPSTSPCTETAVPIPKGSEYLVPGHLNQAGSSKSHYRYWKAAVKSSQKHKEDKIKRRNELNATGLVPADWRDSYTILKKSTISSSTILGADRLWTGSGRRPVSQLRADSIVQPSEWSVSDFRDYVEDLAKSSVSPLRHRQLYRGEESHISAVAEQLVQVFGDIRLERYWSVRACNIALGFYYSHSMLHFARNLYSQMEDHRYLTSTETFNIMLRYSAFQQNIGQVRYLLEAMVNRGLKPNGHTWEAFFLVNESNHFRYTVFQSMRDRGVLDDLHTMHSFLTLNIRKTFSSQLDQGRTVTWFLDYMDKLDQFKWLSTSIGNVLLDEVGKRDSVDEAMDLLDQLEPRGMKSDKVTLNTLLHQCLPIRKHELAIDILRRLGRHKIYPDKVAYESIFRQFCRSRLYNCAKVAWRYACVEGQASSAMRNLVGRSLKRHLEGPPPDPLLPRRSDRWNCLAGVIIVGVDQGYRQDRATYRSVSIETGTPSIDGVADAATTLLKQDLELAHHHHVDRSLPDLLTEALILDRQWASVGAWQHKSLDWFVENSISVKLKHTFPARFLPPEKADTNSYFAKAKMRAKGGLDIECIDDCTVQMKSIIAIIYPPTGIKQ